MKQHQHPTFHTHQHLFESAVVFILLKIYQAPGWTWGCFWTAASIWLIVCILLDANSRLDNQADEE